MEYVWFCLAQLLVLVAAAVAAVACAYGAYTVARVLVSGRRRPAARESPRAGRPGRELGTRQHPRRRG
jgi:hypothetical protein